MPLPKKLQREPVPDADCCIGTIRLDEAVKGGCADPKCTMKPEEHWGMGIEPACHATQKVHVFYDARVKMMEISCGICDRHIMWVKLQEDAIR